MKFLWISVVLLSISSLVTTYDLYKSSLKIKDLESRVKVLESKG